jgi:hypothetical protein
MNSKFTDRFLTGALERAVLGAAAPECDTWHIPVRKYAAGQLRGAEKEAAAGHLKTCAACRLFLLHCMETNSMLIAAADKIGSTDAVCQHPQAVPAAWAEHKAKAAGYSSAGDEKNSEREMKKCREMLALELASLWASAFKDVPEEDLAAFFPELAEKGPLPAESFRCALKKLMARLKR